MLIVWFMENLTILPGLIVDKYVDTLVVQFHTKGMENLKDHIVEALIEVSKTCLHLFQSKLSFKGSGRNNVAAG